MALADYIFQKPVIDTERLTLRPMWVDDVAALKQWLPDPSIYTYWGKGPSKAEKNPEHPVPKDAGKVRLQAGRSDSPRENGQYLV